MRCFLVHSILFSLCPWLEASSQKPYTAALSPSADGLSMAPQDQHFHGSTQAAQVVSLI